MENPNPFEQNKNPKKKIIISLSVVAVIVIGVVVAGMLVEPPLFKGMINLQPVELDPILKEEPVLQETTENSDSTVIINPISEPEIKLISTPPEISFAYLDKLDPKHSSIYGTVNADDESVVLIFKLTNNGTMPAYLNSFETADLCKEGKCYDKLSIHSKLVKLNFDSNNNFTNWAVIGEDTKPTGDPDGNFGNDEMNITTSFLEIPGKSEVVYALVKNTTQLFYKEEATSKSGSCVLVTSTLNVIDGDGAAVNNIKIDSNTVSPQVININF